MIILGDLHFKKAEPYFSGLKKLCSWLVENYKGQTLLLSGDVLDTSSEPWWVVKEFVEFINQFNTHIIHGNHEYSRIKGSALSFLHTYENVTIYTEHKEVEIEETKWLMLPYRYIPEEISAYAKLRTDAKFALSHISPPGMNWGKEEVDLSGLGCHMVFYGHIHPPSEWKPGHTIVGVPQPTREGEQHHKPRMFGIKPDGSVKQIELPVFMTIESVDYGIERENLHQGYLYNFQNSPSIKAVEDSYKGFHIRREGITLKRTIASDKQDISQTKDNIRKSIEDKFRSFALERGKDKEIIDTGIHYLENFRL